MWARLNAAYRGVAYAGRVWKRLGGVYPRECNICGYSGMFKATGLPPRFDARCPSCESLERHRHQALWVQNNMGHLRGRRILHFAPEPILRKLYGELASTYRSADIGRRDADLYLNLEDMDQPDESWDVIVANHVLEHVDDRKALSEIRRVLAPQGLAILSFPVALGFQRTYENPDVTSRAGRELHFGQWDHVRFYGADAADRIAASGFSVEVFSASEPYVHRYSLGRNTQDYLARKI